MPRKRQGHVALWHPWNDRPGKRHSPCLWDTEFNALSIDSLLDTVAEKELYVFVQDILDPEEIAQSEALLRLPKSQCESFISRTGKVVALRLKKGARKSGFIVPGGVWTYKLPPNELLLETVNRVYSQFGYEAITPSSLSEKVLRSTLPEKLSISRPSDPLRRTFLIDKKGGRIDSKEHIEHFNRVYQYDLNKAYLFFTQSLPSPWQSPRRIFYGDSGHQDDRWASFAASWIDVRLTAHGTGVHPIQVPDEEGGMRSPREGEQIAMWMWSEELKDCLAKGYSLDHIDSGWGWTEMSGFMHQWSDIMLEKFEQAESALEENIIKVMMCGLPGRFLKSPEVFTLIHESERKKGDEPVIARWKPDGKVSTPWFIRAEYDIESAQLTPIGSYIVMQCRQAIYKQMEREVALGNRFLSSYIDCITLTKPTRTPEIIGKQPGQFKKKVIRDAYVIENRIITRDKSKMRAPGYADGLERDKLHTKYFDPSNYAEEIEQEI